MSYRILTASEVICDSTNQMTGVINPVLKQEVNKVWSFEFILAPDHPFYDKITEQSTELGVSLDGNDPIFWGTVYGTKTDFYGRKTVLVEDMLGYFNYALMPPHRYNSQNVSDILTVAVTQYNAQCTDKPIELGTVQTTHTTHNLGWSSNYETVLDMLQANVIGKNGGYIRMRYDPSDGKRYLDYSEDYGETRQTIRIGSNLIDFVRDSDASGLVSVLIPLGARLPDEDQTVEGVELRLTIETDQRQTDRIEDNALVTAIGRKAKTRIWDSVDDPDNLYAIGTAWLANQLADVTIEAKAFDLNLADEDIDSIRLYDEVRIISEPHNLDAQFPVMELTMNLNNPSANVLTLGKTEIPSITQTTIEASDRLDDVPTYVDVQNEAAKRAAEVLEDATNGYIKFVYNGSGVLEYILIKDLTDPDNNWWRLGLGGIGYTSDGGTTYDVAMTRLGQLISYFAIIGGWEVNADGLSKTVADPLDNTKRYRVTIYTPNASTPATSPVFDFTTSTDSGTSWVNSFGILGNGSVNAYGSSDTDARLTVYDNTDPNTYMSLRPDGVYGYHADSTIPNLPAIANYRAIGINLYHQGTQELVGIDPQDIMFYSLAGNVMRVTGIFGKNDYGVSQTQINPDTRTWDVMTINKTKICRVSVTRSVTVDNQWGGIYCGEAGVSVPANFPSIYYPVTFASKPLVFASIRSDSSGDGWLCTNISRTEANQLVWSPAYDVCRGTSGNPTITVDYLVIGEVA